MSTELQEIREQRFKVANTRDKEGSPPLMWVAYTGKIQAHIKK